MLTGLVKLNEFVRNYSLPFLRYKRRFLPVYKSQKQAETFGIPRVQSLGKFTPALFFLQPSPQSRHLPLQTFYFIAKLSVIIHYSRGRHGGLVVSALDSGSRGPGSSPGRGHRVLFLGKTLYSQCLSPLRSINGYQQTVRETFDGLASHPGGVATLLVASCYGNREKLRQ